MPQLRRIRLRSLALAFVWAVAAVGAFDQGAAGRSLQAEAANATDSGADNGTAADGNTTSDGNSSAGSVGGSGAGTGGGTGAGNGGGTGAGGTGAGDTAANGTGGAGAGEGTGNVTKSIVNILLVTDNAEEDKAQATCIGVFISLACINTVLFFSGLDRHFASIGNGLNFRLCAVTGGQYCQDAVVGKRPDRTGRDSTLLLWLLNLYTADLWFVVFRMWVHREGHLVVPAVLQFVYYYNLAKVSTYTHGDGQGTVLGIDPPALHFVKHLRCARSRPGDSDSDAPLRGRCFGLWLAEWCAGALVWGILGLMGLSRMSCSPGGYAVWSQLWPRKNRPPLVPMLRQSVRLHAGITIVWLFVLMVTGAETKPEVTVPLFTLHGVNLLASLVKQLSDGHFPVVLRVIFENGARDQYHLAGDYLLVDHLRDLIPDVEVEQLAWVKPNAAGEGHRLLYSYQGRWIIGRRDNAAEEPHIFATFEADHLQVRPHMMRQWFNSPWAVLENTTGAFRSCPDVAVRAASGSAVVANDAEPGGGRRGSLAPGLPMPSARGSIMGGRGKRVSLTGAGHFGGQALVAPPGHMPAWDGPADGYRELLRLESPLVHSELAGEYKKVAGQEVNGKPVYSRATCCLVADDRGRWCFAPQTGGEVLIRSTTNRDYVLQGKFACKWECWDRTLHRFVHRESTVVAELVTYATSEAVPVTTPLQVGEQWEVSIQFPVARGWSPCNVVAVHSDMTVDVDIYPQGGVHGLPERANRIPAINLRKQCCRTDRGFVAVEIPPAAAAAARTSARRSMALQPQPLPTIIGTEAQAGKERPYGSILMPALPPGAFDPRPSAVIDRDWEERQRKKEKKAKKDKKEKKEKKHSRDLNQDRE